MAVNVSRTTSPPCSGAAVGATVGATVGAAVGCEAFSEAVRMSERITKPMCSSYSIIAQVPFTDISRTAVPAASRP